MGGIQQNRADADYVDLERDDERPPCDEPNGCADCLLEDLCQRERAMTRPLFDGSYGDVSRPDEWSGPHGFLLEPLTQPNQQELSRQFLDAADQLVEAIRAKMVADYTIANPALFLYRHAIELILKAALGGDLQGHRLDKLAGELARRCKGQHGQEVPTWIMERLHEIASVDPGSTAFRYHDSCRAMVVNGAWIVRDFHVDINHLQHSVNVLYAALAGLVGKIKPDNEKS